MGMGIRLVVVASTEAIVGNTPAELAGVAGGIQSTFTQLGGVLGSGVPGSAARPAGRGSSCCKAQDACSLSPSSLSLGSCSASWMPRASVMRLLAASAWPSMQWA